MSMYERRAATAATTAGAQKGGVKAQRNAVTTAETRAVPATNGSSGKTVPRRQVGSEQASKSGHVGSSSSSSSSSSNNNTVNGNNNDGRANDIVDLVGHTKRVSCVAWGCDGKFLASGSVDATVRLWQNSKGPSVAILRGHKDAVNDVCFNPSSPHILASASWESTMRIWDARSKSPAASVPLQGSGLISISWQPGGGSLIAASDNKDVVSLVDTRNMRVVKKKKYPNMINCVSWNPRGSHLLLALSANQEGEVDIINTDLKCVRRLCCGTGSCYCVAFDPRGEYFVSGCSNAVVSRWNLRDLVCSASYTSMTDTVNALDVAHDMIAVGDNSPRCSILDVNTGSVLWEDVTGPTMAVAWNPQLPTVAFATKGSGGNAGGRRDVDVHCLAVRNESSN